MDKKKITIEQLIKLRDFRDCIPPVPEKDKDYLYADLEFYEKLNTFVDQTPIFYKKLKEYYSFLRNLKNNSDFISQMDFFMQDEEMRAELEKISDKEKNPANLSSILNHIIGICSNRELKERLRKREQENQNLNY